MFEMILQLIIASILGGVIGFQREIAHKPAGVRTYAFVCLGACLFTILSQSGFIGAGLDPSRVASQVVIGIGFLGAGLIFVRGGHVEGLTTAAGLWVTAAIGMAIGVGWYAIAFITSALVLVFLMVGRKFQRIEERLGNHGDDERLAG